MSDYVNDRGAEAYALNRHGPDGAVLLDPFFQRHIRARVEGRKVIDIGTGAAPWAVYAVKEAGAAAVRGFDNSDYMLEQAQDALAQQPEEVSSRIEVNFSTVKQLPVEDESFDVALSINVGCALPSYQSKDPQGRGTLRQHLTEMSRVLIPGGFGIVTAPTALARVYTTIGDEEAKVAELSERVSRAQDDEDLRRTVGSLDSVLRATIVKRNGAFRIAQRGDLMRGTKVNRKIPGVVVPNFAHTPPEYEEAFRDLGLDVVDADKPKLTVEQAELAGLSATYTQQSPFATYLVQKPKN